jgi:tetratricopeptide (TPR) repeat protein
MARIEPNVSQQTAGSLNALVLRPALLLRAEARVKSGRYAEAITDYDRLLRLPKSPLSGLAPEANLRAVRAVAIAYAGDHAQAIAEAEKALQEDEEPGTPYDAARVYAIVSGKTTGDPASRQRYAARAVALLHRCEDLNLSYAPSTTIAMRKDAAFNPLRGRDDFRRIVESAALILRAQRDAMNGDLRKAAAGFVKVLELNPTCFWAWYQYGSILAYQRDEKFKEHCRGMLERFGDTTDRNRAERITRTIGCVPLETSGVPPQRLVEMADRALAGDAPAPDLSWFQLAKGIAEYRVGRFDAAARWLAKVPPSELADYNLAQLYLAMAQYRLGDRARAAETFARAAKIMEHEPQPGTGKLINEFHDQLFALLALREAEAMIRGPATAPATRPSVTTAPSHVAAGPRPRP